MPTGFDSPLWSKAPDGHGYMLLKTPDGWALEHRWVVEQQLGRKLKPSEHVHHVNGVKTDNALTNLLVVPHKGHKRLYHTGYRTKEWFKWNCLVCGKAKETYPSWAEKQKRNTGEYPRFCSVVCVGKWSAGRRKRKRGGTFA